MYILPSTLIRLSMIAFLYIASMFLWFDPIQIYIMLFAVIPITVFVMVLSHPFLVYGAFLLCSLIVISYKGISITFLFNDYSFWAVQCFLMLSAVFVSVLRSYRIPYKKILQEEYFKKLDFDRMALAIDVKLRTIHSITKNACLLYGKPKRHLAGNSINMIHLDDIFSNPPEGFWETLEKHGQWCGSVDVALKNQLIGREISCYTAVYDKNQNISMLEKRILEVYLKKRIDHKESWFNQFYEECPMPLAVINRKHKVESANPHFMKELSVKPVIDRTVFSEIFPSFVQEQIKSAVAECLKGVPSDFEAVYPSLSGDCRADFKFRPYYCKNERRATHALCFIQKIIESPKTVYENKEINITDLIKLSLEEWHGKHLNSSIKLFSATMPSFDVNQELWNDAFSAVFLFADRYLDSKKIIVSCTLWYSKYYFRIAFKDTKISRKSELLPKMGYLFRNIENISNQFGFAENDDGDMVLVIEFYKK